MPFRRALVVGFDHYAKYLADLINEQADGWRATAFTESRLDLLPSLVAAGKADAIVAFGGPGPNVALSTIARERNIPVIVIWAGSDISQALEKRIALEVVKREGFVNVADGEWLVDELAQLGLESEYNPVTAVRPGGRVAPLPSSFRVITYLPEPRRAFYGAEETYELARRLPDIQFEVTGPGKPNKNAPPNVTFTGYVLDVEAHLDDSTVLLRMPQHDGKSMFVLEALARARHVVWNHDFPCVNYAPTFEDAYGQLRSLADAHARGELQPNYAGREFVLKNFMRDQIGTAFLRILNREVEKCGQRHLAPRARRAVISGLDLFCSTVAREINARPAPPWHVDILRTGARLEVVTSLVNLLRSEIWYSIGSPVTDRWLDTLAYLLRKKRVIHWVGSDIEVLKRRPRLAAALRRPNVLHLTEVEWTQRELADLGIPSRLAPLPPRNVAHRVTPLPEKFTVLLYLPKTRGCFYGGKQYRRLVSELRHEDVRFLIVGGGSIDIPDGVDAINVGWDHDLAKIYEASSVLVRFTERDGLSLMVLEALSFGRHVMWTQPFPATNYVPGYEELRDGVLRLYRQHKAGTLGINEDGVALVQNRYAVRPCIETIVRSWHDLLSGKRPEPITAEPNASTTALSS